MFSPNWEKRRLRQLKLTLEEMQEEGVSEYWINENIFVDYLNLQMHQNAELNIENNTLPNPYSHRLIYQGLIIATSTLREIVEIDIDKTIKLTTP